VSFPAPFTTATAGEQKFVFVDSGQGPLVVLLHGFPDTPNGWAPAAATLNAAGFRTVVPYLRGYHPDTIVPGRRYGGEEIGEDVIRLLDAIGADRAALVGHDWGAASTYRAAALAPDRIQAVGAVAIPHPRLLKPSARLLWDGRHFVTLRLPTGAWLARRNDFAYIDALIRRWAPNWSGADREATLSDAKEAFADARVLDGALAYYRDTSREGLRNLPQPGLIVGGTTDIVPAEMLERTPQSFDGPCDVMMIDGAGHWPHREASAKFEERLVAFLKDVL
jgi:pimeloyl-ACP methyl ester carboxylesterase